MGTAITILSTTNLINWVVTIIMAVVLAKHLHRCKLDKQTPLEQERVLTPLERAWRRFQNLKMVPKEKSFVYEIAKAISITFTFSSVLNLSEVEKENRWETFLSAQNLKLIIIPDMLLWTTPRLLSFYKEVPGNTLRKLGSVPVLLLPDLSLYRKDPLLKRSLWNVICQMLA